MYGILVAAHDVVSLLEGQSSGLYIDALQVKAQYGWNKSIPYPTIPYDVLYWLACARHARAMLVKMNKLVCWTIMLSEYRVLLSRQHHTYRLPSVVCKAKRSRSGTRNMNMPKCCGISATSVSSLVYNFSIPLAAAAHIADFERCRAIFAEVSI